MEQHIIDAIENCGLEVSDVRELVNIVSANAIDNFVNYQIMVFAGGCRTNSNITLFSLYQYSLEYNKSNYSITLPSFCYKWGTDMVGPCSGGFTPYNLYWREQLKAQQ